MEDTVNSNRNEYRKDLKKKKQCFGGVKRGWCVGLKTLPPSMSRLSRQCGILNISQPYWPSRPVTGIYLLFVYINGNSYCITEKWPGNICLQALSASLRSAPGQLYPVKADLTRQNEVCSVFRWVKSNLGGVDVLINSAGVASANTLVGGFTV
jgi:hypothetical protein